jgi:hypothetical protein
MRSLSRYNSVIFCPSSVGPFGIVSLSAKQMGNGTSELCKVCHHRLCRWVSVNLESKKKGKKKENRETKRERY